MTTTTKPDSASSLKGFNRPVTPSKELAAIIGDGAMPRTEVVSRVWAYIKKHGLQDPADKRTIVADAKLRAVLGQDRIGMFEMNRLISAHVTTAPAAPKEAAA